jgi:hypothetical protein
LFEGDRVDHAHAALAVLLSFNGLRVSEACSADIENLGFERGHRPLRSAGKGNKLAVIPLVPTTATTIDLAIGERRRPRLRRAGPRSPTARFGGSPTRTSSWSTSRAPAAALRDLAHLPYRLLPAGPGGADAGRSRCASPTSSSPGSRTVRPRREARSSLACSCMRITSHRGSACPTSSTSRFPTSASSVSGGADPRWGIPQSRPRLGGPAPQYAGSG